jgi:DNA-binding LacI/PurR family transcriptional regulator
MPLPGPSGWIRLRSSAEEVQLRRFAELGVSGLIIASMARTYRISGPIRALHDRGFPYAMVSYTAGDDIPFIGMDLEKAGALAANHLVEHGRRRVGYVGEKADSEVQNLRGIGFRKAMEENNLPVDPDFVFQYPYEGEWNDYRSGYAVGEQVAELPVKPDGVFVFNDLGALGFEDALLDRGISVPDDIAIIGVDDIELAPRARVPLSTVRQPVNTIGSLAVDSVVRQLKGGPRGVRTLLEPELVVRRSSVALSEGAEPDALPMSAFAPASASAAPRG